MKKKLFEYKLCEALIPISLFVVGKVLAMRSFVVLFNIFSFKPKN